MAEYILAINPGSTSTKLALFAGTAKIYSEKITYTAAELEGYRTILAQQGMRLKNIYEFIAGADINVKNLAAVAGRGGLLNPVPGGVYRVNERMLEDLKRGVQGKHVSNLGGILARNIADRSGCEAFVVDPVSLDEMNDVARISGHPLLQRRSLFHGLNQKAVARKFAEETGIKYHRLTIIAAHLGGGISVGLHRRGRVVDVNNALSGEGPFSPNRSGGLPALDLVKLCFSSRYSEKEIREMLVGRGGVAAYLGTEDIKEVEKQFKEGVEESSLIFKAMAYQVAKEIGSLAPAAEGQIDAILLTGGIARSEIFTSLVKKKISFIAPVKIYPGEEELSALAGGVYRVLSGVEEPRVY